MFLSHHLLVLFFFVSISLLCFFPVFEAATDTLTTPDSLSFNQTLISEGGKFELGFFSKGNPSRYYVGIRYNDIPSDDIYVWVANRDAPLLSDSCSMKLGNHGNLVILDDGSRIWWSSNQSKAVNPVVQLLDSGNLVIREAYDRNPDHYLWQSFDHPTDTLLPGQKLGWNLKTGLNRFLTSWKGPDDPGSGQFSLKLDYHGDPEIYLWHEENITYRVGPWIGIRFSGIPEMKLGQWGVNYSLYTGPDEVYYTFKLRENDTAKSRVIITYDGHDSSCTWFPDARQWVSLWNNTGDICDNYKACGPNGVCNTSGLFYCQCPQGFKPKNPQAWALRDGLNGCVRKNNFNCSSDEFLVLDNMKLPQTSTAFVNESMNLDECRDMCKKDCNCTAYANSKMIEGVGIGCINWKGDLIDMRSFPEIGQNLYIRMAVPNLANVTKRTKRTHTRIHVLIAISTVVAIILLAVGIWMRMTKDHDLMKAPKLSVEIDEIKTVESLQSDLNSIKLATQDFSENNKLGEGGFGEVYKGKLEDGQEIAVKRLSKSSAQGIMEFKNEILLVAKLQHKNLVKLLGFCLTSNEKILIYEYLRNSSLDQVLFGPTKRLFLDWHVRFKVVVGIARGLLYLHEDSRLKIIHRDLKASNILLDENMNPKISDFGLAKLFGMDQTQDNTKRIVGTYGYMSPEYAMTGHFSVKSDIYSFGVIVLEIVSGQRNRYFGRHQLEEALLHRAWRLWDEGKALDLVDTGLGNDYPEEEVTKCIQIGLLCVQERAIERPKMDIIVAALSGQSVNLPVPKAPNFFGAAASATMAPDTSMQTGSEMITDLFPR